MAADDATRVKRGVIWRRRKMRKKHPPEPMGTGREEEGGSGGVSQSPDY